MKKYLVILFLLLLFFFPQTSFCQNKQVTDSLLQLLSQATDTTKVLLLLDLAEQHYVDNPEQALIHSQEALKLSQQINYVRGVSQSLNKMGLAYINLGSYNKALETHQQALKIRRQLNDSISIAGSLNNIGEVYRHQGDYANALEYYFKSLNIKEKLNNKKSLANTLNNIGLVYNLKADYDRALTYFQRGMALRKEVNAEAAVATSLNAIGWAYFKKNNFSQALSHFNQSLAISQKLGLKTEAAHTFSNIANVYIEQKKYSTALQNYFKALRIREETNNKVGICDTYLGISFLYLKIKKYDETIYYTNKGLKIAHEIGAKAIAYGLYDNMQVAYAAIGDYEKAYKYQQLYLFTKDSVFNEESDKRLQTLQEGYEAHKRKTQIDLLKKEKAYHELEIKEQKYIVYGLTGGISLFVSLVLLLIRSNQQKRRTNQMLTMQNEQINQQKEEISRQAQFLMQANEEIVLQSKSLMHANQEITLQNKALEEQRSLIERKNRDIESSIRYAKRIQNAMLPQQELIQKILPEHFVLLLPRDIVSGDFYWFSDILSPEGELSHAIIAAVDCTGHGVPGAFMSMIADSLLSQIVNDRGIIQPNIILQEMHKGVRRALHQEGGENRDGMDMAICCIDFEHKLLHYAGANQSMLLIYERENESLVEEIKPDKRPIGGWQREEERFFTLHSFPIEPETRFYLFSDGYQDQFGGENNRKFSFKRLRELILQIHREPMAEQKKMLHQTLLFWQGKTPQIDDVMVIGVKLS